jgi:hypothetical protein
MLTHEGEIRLSSLRAKRAQGVELSIDEMREVVEIISAGRKSAAASSAASKRKVAAGVVRSAEDMLKDMLP